MTPDLLSDLERVDASHPGVVLGIMDTPIVDRHFEDDSYQPTEELSRITPGSKIKVEGVETRVSDTTREGISGDLFQIGFYPDFVGTVSSMWVDRDPFLLSVCNGGIYAVDPNTVKPVISTLEDL